MLKYYLCVIASIISATICASLSGHRRLQVETTYKQAMTALKQENLTELKEILETRRDEIDDALNFNVAEESLLFTAAIVKNCKPKFYQILAECGIEIGGSRAFRIAFYAWSLSPCKMLNLPEERIKVLQELVELGFLRLEELWRVAIRSRNVKMFTWMIENGADLEHRIPSGVDGVNFETVSAACARILKFDFLHILLQLGVNVNSCPANGFENLWNLLIISPTKIRCDVLKLVASQTINLFTPFYIGTGGPNFTMESNYFDNVATIVNEELKRRLNDASFDLSAFDRVDSQGRTLIDSLSFLMCATKKSFKFRKTVQILRDAGLAANFPLSDAFYTCDVAYLKVLIDSGKVNYNECFVGQIESILYLLIKAVWIEPKIIESMIDHGADVNFSSELDDSNAYILVYKTRTGYNFPKSIQEKILGKLNSDELKKSLKFKREIDN